MTLNINIFTVIYDMVSKLGYVHQHRPLISFTLSPFFIQNDFILRISISKFPLKIVGFFSSKFELSKVATAVPPH